MDASSPAALPESAEKGLTKSPKSIQPSRKRSRSRLSHKASVISLMSIRDVPPLRSGPPSYPIPPTPKEKPPQNLQLEEGPRLASIGTPKLEQVSIYALESETGCEGVPESTQDEEVQTFDVGGNVEDVFSIIQLDAMPMPKVSTTSKNTKSVHFDEAKIQASASWRATDHGDAPESILRGNSQNT
jgi:hypothetical protein